MDPPPHINWYQGLLGVNNEKSQSPRFIDRLLWRYHNAKDECDHKNQEPPVLASVINFALLAYLLFRFGKGPVMSALAKRKKDITQDIDSANELKQDAEKRLTSYQRQLNRIEERRQELVEEHRLQWEIEKKRILDEAQEKSDRLRKDARFRVDQELKQAQVDMLRESIDAAVAAAEDLIKTRVQGADQERLADEYLAGVAASLQPGRAPAKGAQEKA
jgi:F-type H+-transporting ATPase subunit b